MDPASIDPRLHEDSIVVHNSTQDQNVPVPAGDPPPQIPFRQPSETSIPPAPTFLPPPSPSTSQIYPPHPSAAVAIAPAPTATPTATAAASLVGSDAAQDSNDPKRSRACEACRGLKVKCESEGPSLEGPCKRCAKAGRPCVITQPTRKRQKKTDSRVAELEKKIDALTASLHAKQEATGNGQPPPAPPASTASTPTHFPGPCHSFRSSRLSSPSGEEDEDEKTKIAHEWGPPVLHPVHRPVHTINGNARQDNNTMTGRRKRKFGDEVPAEANEGPSSFQPSSAGQHRSQPDVIDRGIINSNVAHVLFQRYTERMTTHLPAVVFPPGTTAVELRETSPILFLAIMSAASSETPNTQRVLARELMQVFADKIVIQGEKSLELVQALMISVIWYCPPEHFEQLKFYQLVHMAAVMAIDIGLGKRKTSSKSRLVPYTWRDHPFRKNPLPDPMTIESRRTWLAVYFLASNVAMALHRPNLIKWQSFMAECIDILESSPAATPSDRCLCHLVWTHRLAEEVGIQFSFDDPSVFVNITETRVQYVLRKFETDLAKYSESMPKEYKKPSLILSFHVLSLYVHEIALQNNEELGTPNPQALRDPILAQGATWTSAHINALSSCLMAIDGMFDVFLSLDIATIRCLPIFNFVRVAYALVVLIKIYFSASSPGAELGKVIDRQHLRVAEYIAALQMKLTEATANDKSRPASKFLLIITMIRKWFHQQGQNGSQDHNTDPAMGPSPGPSNNATPGPPGSQDTESHTNMSHPQQYQHQSQPEYGSVNTPLHLLSEVATGNGPSRNQNGSAPPGTNAAVYPIVLGPSVHLPYMLDPNAGLETSGAIVGPVNQSFVAWPEGPFGTDMDYMSMGDSLEQAMGLALTGFGGGSPGDPVSYENSMRYINESISLNGHPMSPLDEFPILGENPPRY